MIALGAVLATLSIEAAKWYRNVSTQNRTEPSVASTGDCSPAVSANDGFVQINCFNQRPRHQSADQRVEELLARGDQCMVRAATLFRDIGVNRLSLEQATCVEDSFRQANEIDSTVGAIELAWLYSHPLGAELLRIHDPATEAETLFVFYACQAYNTPALQQEVLEIMPSVVSLC